MTSRKQLNIFWAENSFDILETEKGYPTKMVVAPFGWAEELIPPQSQDAPEGIKLTAVIEKALQDQRIIAKSLNLSLPTKDIIFRSFVIPFMPAHEIKGVVPFEANKYIPFKIDDLSYTYYAIPFVENKVKKIKILFAAVRRSMLERYCGILEHSALNINCMEPASVSLGRLLIHKKLISPSQTAAVLIMQKQESHIIVFEDGVVHFVREFQILKDPHSTKAESDSPNTKLLSEVRISLDYHARQQAKDKVTKMLLLSESGTELTDLSNQLQQEFGIPTSPINARSLLNTNTASLGLLNAYGIGVRDVVPGLNHFDLSLKKTKSQNLEMKSIWDFRPLKKPALACLGIILLNFVFCHFLLANDKKKLAALTAQQGAENKSIDINQIQTKTKDLADKLLAYKDVRTQSNLAYNLILIPKLLPDGVWLDKFSVEFYDKPFINPKAPSVTKDNKPGPKKVEFERTIPKTTVNFAAYAYQQDVNQQLRLVNELVSNLKNDSNFSSQFESIDLLNVRTQDLNSYPVTQFEIRAQ